MFEADRDTLETLDTLDHQDQPIPIPTKTTPAVDRNHAKLEALWTALAQTFIDRLADTENPPRGSTLEVIRKWLADNNAVLESFSKLSGQGGRGAFGASSSFADRLAESMKDANDDGTDQGVD